MPPRSTPFWRTRASLTWVAIAGLAIAAYYLFSAWAMNAHLARASAAQLQRLESGWTWNFDTSADLVGGSGRALSTRFGNGTVSGERAQRDGFLSLNFRARRLDAQLFTRLELRIRVDHPDQVRLFHRPVPGGRILVAPPIPLESGWQRVQVDLSRLAWFDFEQPGEAASWGGTAGTVADLRVHPLTLPGAFEIDYLVLAPAQPLTDELPILSLETAHEKLATPSPALPRTAIVQVDVLDQRPALLMSWMREAEAVRPAWVWQPASSWWKPPYWCWPILAGSAAILALGTRKLRRTGWLLALLGSAAWLLAVPPRADALAPPALALILTVFALVRTERPRLRWTATTGWKTASVWMATLGLPVLAWALLGEATEFEGIPFRLLLYAPWAALQQAILQGLLIPAVGGHRSVRGHAIGAALFGLLHFPNFTLMTITLGLAGLTGSLYRRFGALPPLIALHAVLGTLYLELLPRDWIWSGAVGLRFFGN